jgi:hypothetical protein
MSHLIGNIATITKIAKTLNGVEYPERMLTGRVLSEDVTFNENGDVTHTTITVDSLVSITANHQLRQRLTITVED